MAHAAFYSKSGVARDKKATLSDVVFGLTVTSQELVGQAYRMYLANGRSAGASTLTRGLVSGGGRKPWRQKGTGRARVGSTRVPNWRHGGVVFGPTGNENYTLTMPVKAKRLAIRQALSLRAENIVVIESFDGGEGRVRSTNELIKKLGLRGRILLVVNEKTSLVDRATRNLAGVKAVDAMYLNVYEIMNAGTIVITELALPLIEGWLAPLKKDETATQESAS